MTANLDPRSVHLKRQFRPLPGLELRISLFRISFLAAAKEVLERHIQMTKAGVYGAFRNLRGSRELLPPDSIELLLEGIGRGLPASIVLAYPLGQTPIEGKSRRSARLAEILILFRRRMEPDLMCSLHRSFPFVSLSVAWVGLWRCSQLSCNCSPLLESLVEKEVTRQQRRADRQWRSSQAQSNGQPQWSLSK